MVEMSNMASADLFFTSGHLPPSFLFFLSLLTLLQKLSAVKWNGLYHTHTQVKQRAEGKCSDLPLEYVGRGAGGGDLFANWEYVEKGEEGGVRGESTKEEEGEGGGGGG